MCVRGAGLPACLAPDPLPRLWPCGRHVTLVIWDKPRCPSPEVSSPGASPQPTQLVSINMRRSTVCNRSQLWAVLGSPWRKPLLSSLNSSAFM